MKTGRIQVAVKWHSRKFTRAGCKPMIFVQSNQPIRCYLQACKGQYLFFGSIHFTMHFVWKKLLEGNVILMFSDGKCIPSLFLSY